MCLKQGSLPKAAVLISVLTIALLGLSACGDAKTTTPATTAVTTTRAAAITSMGKVATVAPVPNGNRTGVTDTEIKLGAIGPTNSPIGLPLKVLEAYFQRVNEQGGIYGRKIKFITENNDLDAAKSLVAAKKLTEQEQVLALTGVIAYPIPELQDYMEQQGIPCLPYISPSTKIYDPPRKTQFGFFPSLYSETRFLVDYAVDELGAKKLAIAYQPGLIGEELVPTFQAEAQAKGVPVVAKLVFNTTDQDTTKQSTLLQQSGADFVYIPSSITNITALIEQIATWPNKPKIMISSYMNDAAFFKSKGNNAEGIYSSWLALQPDGNDMKSVEFRAFMEKYLPDAAIGPLTQGSYIMGQIIVEALRRAGKDLSRETLVAGAESIINWRDSYANNVTYGPLNRAPINSVYVTQYKDGKIQKVSDWYTLK